MLLLCAHASFDADADHVGVDVGVGADALRHVAEFLRADAGEGEGKEEQHGVLLSEVGREGDVFQAIRIFRLEREVRRFGSDGNRHMRKWLD
jgi:hypothetical protein